MQNALIAQFRSRLPAQGKAHLHLRTEDRYYFTAALLAAAALGLPVELAPARPSADRALEGGEPEPKWAEISLKDADVLLLDAVAVREAAQSSEGACTPAQGHLGPIAFDLSGLRVAFWTSGSQAEPRRWEKTVQALIAEARMLQDFWRLKEGERVLSAAPPHHIYGFLWGVLLPLVSQASVFRGRARHAGAILEALGASNAQRVIAVPAQLAALRSASLALNSSAESLQGVQVISSGAPLGLDLARELEGLNLSIVEVLGSTETGGIAFRSPAQEREFEALPGVNLSASPEGFLVVSSPFVDPPGIPKLTADRVALDGRRFRHLGRADSTVKIGANRISLEEVAERARSVSGVREARALTLPATGSTAHEADLALVAVAPGFSRSALKEALHRELPPEFWPKRVRVVDHMPVDERGKSPLKLLDALFRSSVRLQVEPVASDENSTVAEYDLFVPTEAHCLVGHFPNAPVVPGAVLLGDAVIEPAQGTWPDLCAPYTLGSVRFLAPLEAGATARVRLIRSQAKVDFRVTRRSETLVQGSVLFTETLGASKHRHPA